MNVCLYIPYVLLFLHPILRKLCQIVVDAPNNIFVKKQKSSVECDLFNNHVPKNCKLSKNFIILF